MNDSTEGLILSIILLIVVGWVGGAMANKKDRRWLPSLVAWAFVVKILGSWARYYMVTEIYGRGDSYSYHFWGGIFANSWRSFAVPVSSSSQPGTAFTEVATGFLYAPYIPRMLGGFLIFATVAFAGQLLFYAAVRRWISGKQLKFYALAVLLLPSLVFWPSSIGKDALMVFFLGLTFYGASRLLQTYEFMSLLFLGPGLLLAASVRSHVAAVAGLAVVLAAFFGRPPKEVRGSPKRAVMVVLAMLGAGVVLATFSSTFGVTFEGGRDSVDYQTFLEDVSTQTATGGSEISGGPISNPLQLPGAAITVLFRPLVYEAGSAQALLSAMEGTALLLIVLWKFPTMWKNKGLLRENPFFLLCFFYTGGFIIGFSAFLNLGLLARQRVQVLPLLLALLVGLGWPTARPKAAAEEAPRAPEEKPAPPVRVSRKPLPTLWRFVPDEARSSQPHDYDDQQQA